ncbi:MAG: adenylate/guanylate cyclase domain-containing protein [Desulfovibrionaceae bacterium]
MSTVTVPSFSSPDVTYAINPALQTCTCREWTTRRFRFEEGDPRRLCKHQLKLLLEEQEPLPPDAEDAREDRLFRRVLALGVDFPLCRFYEPMAVMNVEYDVFFRLNRKSPWVDVISDDGVFSYNLIEKRWDRQRVPVEGSGVVDAILAVLDEEQGAVTKEKKRRRFFRFSVRFGIASLATFLVVLAGGLVLGVSWFGGTRAVGHLTQSIMNDKAEFVIDKTLNYMDPASGTAVLLSGYLAGYRAFDQFFDSDVRRLIGDYMDANEQIVRISYATPDGSYFMVRRMPDGSRSAQVVTLAKGRAMGRWMHANNEWSATLHDTEDSLDTAQGLTQTPWYQRAVGRGEMVWTDVYIFDEEKTPGLTCAVPVQADGVIQGVVGVDVSVGNLAFFLNRLTIGTHGKAYIINRQGEIISMPLVQANQLHKLVRTTEKDGVTTFSLRKAQVAPDKAFAMSATLYLESVTAGEATDSLAFSVENQAYIAMYKDFPSGRNAFPWRIGIVAPERDFMGTIYEYGLIILYAAVMVILFAVMIGMRLARIFSNPLDYLSREMHHIRDFQLESEEELDSPIIEVDTMARSLDNMKSGLRSFKKFVPAELVRDLIALGQEAELGGENRTITTLFTDIAGFTKISEETPPDDLVMRLGDYLSHLSVIIHQQQGTVDKYIGDAIMAFWGAPLMLEDHAFKACRAALQCQAVLRGLEERWKESDIPMFHTRFGINTGKAIVGNMGAPERLNYTALGDSINLASRLESLNKQYGTKILLSENTYRQVHKQMAARRLDLVAVKGKQKPVYIFELVAELPDLTEEQQHLITLFEQGFDRYLQRDWPGAQAVFNEVLLARPDDGPAKVFIERCDYFAANPPEQGWTGVFVAKSK